MPAEPAGYEPGRGGKVPCKPGHFKRSAGAYRCSACPAGTIQPGSGHTACIKCPAGRTSNPARTFCSESLQPAQLG